MKVRLALATTIKPDQRCVVKHTLVNRPAKLPVEQLQHKQEKASWKKHHLSLSATAVNNVFVSLSYFLQRILGAYDRFQPASFHAIEHCCRTLLPLLLHATKAAFTTRALLLRKVPAIYARVNPNFTTQIKSKHKGMNKQVIDSEMTFLSLQASVPANTEVLESANTAFFKRQTFLTSVARNRLTPIMLDSLLIVSLGLISTGPLQPTTC